MATYSVQPARHRHTTCNDHVVGAILSGWRYDISGISPDLRRDYEEHLRDCEHCRNKQRLHRTVDMLLFTTTTVSFAAFLLAMLVLHRVRVFTHHISTLHVHLLPEAGLVHAHIPASITLSLQAVAGLGVLVSMLLWVLVAVATPVPVMVTGMLRERASHHARERYSKAA